MSVFNTHGGYFTPQGYFKVNEGGSHEENPNGGVQIGVDNQGVPNMLEEGEPVYNDYVYSDNIKADKAMLEKHNIPVKYAGKLYSEIADEYVDEAEERPNDPISNNGLNAMLVRLADAQEEQKAIKQQKELEDELASLSPEELEQLGQMLDEQEAVQQPVPEDAMVQPDAMPVEDQVVMQQAPMDMTQAQPLMACGGKISRQYWPGGTLLKRVGDAVQEAKRNVQAKVQDALGIEPVEFDGEVVGGPGVLSLLAGAPALVGPIRAAQAGQRAKTVADAMEKAYEGAEAVQQAAKAGRAARKAARAAETGWKGWGRMFYDPLWAGKRIAKEASNLKDWQRWTLTGLGGVAGAAPASLTYGTAGNLLFDAGKAAVDAVQARTGASSEAQYEASRASDPFAGMYKNGGKMNTYEDGTEHLIRIPRLIDALDNQRSTPLTITSFRRQAAQPAVIQSVPAAPASASASAPAAVATQSGARAVPGTWDQLINDMNNYTVSRNRGNVSGTYRIDPNFHRGYGFNTISDLENSDVYKNFTDYVLTHPNDPNVLRYLRAVDAGVAGNNNVPLLFDGDNLRSDWADQYRRLRNDQKGGIYHFMGNNLEGIRDLIKGHPIAAVDSSRIPVQAEGQTTDSIPYVPATSRENPVNPVSGSAGAGARDARMLPTWPRYAGAATAGLLALHNVFQDPDEYNIPHVQPVLPYGRMGFINPAYNPIDQNQAVNNVMASNAGNTIAIMNSGIGPSIGATLLAQDYNTGRNVGNALSQVWAANNAERNNVINAVNTNAARQAQFDYGVNRDRAQIINDFRFRNAMNDFTAQRMNYAAEAQKYAAIQQELDAIAQALAGIGQENFAMNQLNSNTAFDYGVGRRGWNYYQGV